MPLKVNLAHHPLQPFGGVLDLAHVLPQHPAVYVLRRGSSPRSLLRITLALSPSTSDRHFLYAGLRRF